MKLAATLLISLIALTGGVGCDKTYIIPTGPTATTVTGNGNPVPNPTPGSPVVVSSKIEFRVTGNALGARIRISDAVNGLNQITTTLPYTFTVTTSLDSMFVSLESTPTSYGALTSNPFHSVQIFTNGVLFREASSTDFFLSTVSVSGTWRR
jgi:hypothetical protein